MLLNVNSRSDWKSEFPSFFFSFQIFFLEISMKLLDMLICLDVISCGNSCALRLCISISFLSV